ncbi:MAG: cupredoxin domain-containing protein [Pyrinomonadaceae bacterium]
MSTQMIEIRTNPIDTPGQPAVFDPRDAVTYAYDTITWHNGDAEPHHPTPDASTPNAWFEYQIPPGGTSDTLAPGPNTTTPGKPYTLNYVCSIHPKETGTITVNPQQ